MSSAAFCCCRAGDRCWFVLKTKPRKEHSVQRQLQDVGVEAYFPLLKSFKKDLGKGQSQIEPFFPGYVFAQLDPGAGFFHLRGVSGFTSVVSFDGQPARLHPRVIEDFRIREKGHGYILMHHPTPKFSFREAVRVVSGPFRGYRGLFVRHLDSKLRICVLLDILKRQTPVELPLGSVSASVSTSALGRYGQFAAK